MLHILQGMYDTKIQGESWKVVEGTNHLVKGEAQ